MSTALDLIKRSLRLIGAIASAETPDGATGQDALYVLNTILKEWSTQRLLSYYVKNYQYALTVNTGQYTIGTAGGEDFNGERPLKIIDAFVRDCNNKDYVLEIISDLKYNSIYTKTENATPIYLRYLAIMPAGQINLFPVPDKNYTLNLACYLPLTNITNINQILYFPEGWENALSYQLAAEIAPEYGKQPEPFYSLAKEKKGLLKSINVEIDTLGVDNALVYNLSGYDVISDSTCPVDIFVSG